MRTYGLHKWDLECTAGTPVDLPLRRHAQPGHKSYVKIWAAADPTGDGPLALQSVLNETPLAGVRFPIQFTAAAAGLYTVFILEWSKGLSRSNPPVLRALKVRAK